MVAYAKILGYRVRSISRNTLAAAQQHIFLMDAHSKQKNCFSKDIFYYSEISPQRAPTPSQLPISNASLITQLDHFLTFADFDASGVAKHSSTFGCTRNFWVPTSRSIACPTVPVRQPYEFPSFCLVTRSSLLEFKVSSLHNSWSVAFSPAFVSNVPQFRSRI